MNYINQYISENKERFLEELGAQNTERMDFLDFTNYVERAGIQQKVEIRRFEIEGRVFTQAYVKNSKEEKYVYMTIID